MCTASTAIIHVEDEDLDAAAGLFLLQHLQQLGKTKCCKPVANGYTDFKVKQNELTNHYLYHTLRLPEYQRMIYTPSYQIVH